LETAGSSGFRGSLASPLSSERRPSLFTSLYRMRSASLLDLRLAAATHPAFRVPLPRRPDAAEDVGPAITVRRGPAHQPSCGTRRTLPLLEIVPGDGARKVASAERTPVELDRRLSIRRGQLGRESEIASGGGVYLRRWPSRSLANCADGEV
jgi:hypothetical protein